MKKFKENFKRFWSLQKHSTGGFTLVELIVVIAILAILAGIAVPAYSGYVEKANKQADQTLVSEVKQALELYHYSNPEATKGYVVLEQDGTAVTKYDEVGAAAMEDMFGANWQTAVGLKYDGWKGESSTLSYKESSYFGQEDELIETVDKLSTALGEVVANDRNMANTLIAGGFKDFLDKQNVDQENGKAVGNAAVLYVAEKTQGKETEIKSAFSAGLSGYVDPTNPAGSVVNNLYAELYRTDIGDAACLAAIYAYAEGFAQSTDQADSFHANTDFSAVTDVGTALAALENSFSKLNINDFSTYASAQGSKDLQGYIDMMGTVHNNANIVSGNLNSADCFTDGVVENMLKGHAALSELNVTTTNGQMAVVFAVDGEGDVMVHVTPANWNR